MGFLIFSPFLILIGGVLLRVFIALSIYNDAKALYNDNAVMWGVLSGLLGLIPCIIYLCIRKSGRGMPVQLCVYCRNKLFPGTQVCPYCGSGQPPYNPYAPVYDPEAEAFRAQAKRFLIAALISLGVVIACYVIIFAVAGLTSYSNPGYYNEYPYYY